MKRRDYFILAAVVPLVLLLVAVIAFGLLIPRLGFYWDDWAKILVSRLFGLDRYVAYYAEDRPLSAWTHILFTPLFGSRPAAWQAFALLLRWLSAWGFYACLSQVWPQARRQNLAAALLFLVYPAFIQQPAAVTFFQQWLQYALFFFSVYAMLRAAQLAGRRFWAWSIAALLAMLLQLSVTEYLVPVELIRPLALWLLFKNQEIADPEIPPRPNRILRVLIAWAPYLVSLAAYTAWRLFFIRLPGEDPYRANTLYDFLASPLETVGSLAQVMLVDIQQIMFDSWTALLKLQLMDVPPFTLLAYGIGLLTAGGIVFVLLRLPEPDEPGRARWIRQAFVFGLVALLLGPIPAWITGRQVVFDFHSDRYALPAIFGASLVWSAILEWVAQRRFQRAVLVGLLLALAVSLHLRSGNAYRWNWTDQQRLYWQLAWRAPGLRSQTALFFETEPISNQGLFSTSAAINLLYPQPAGIPRDSDTGERLLGYWVYTLKPRFREPPNSFQFGLSTRFRTLKFSGETPDSLLLFYDPKVANCLWLLSPDDALHPYLSDLTKSFLPISDLARVLRTTTPGFPPSEIFGSEPAHTWCYYYEKASLAGQFSDWEEVARLGDEAQARGYHPNRAGSNSPYEWIPFIQGYAYTGRWEEASDLTISAFKKDPHYSAMLCELWVNRMNTLTGAGESGASYRSSEVQSTLACQNITAAP